MPNRNVEDVVKALKALQAKGGDIILRLETPEPQMVDRPGRTTIDEFAPKITEKKLAGWSIYNDKGVTGRYEFVVAHREHGHVLLVIALDDNGEPYITGKYMQQMVSTKDGHDDITIQEGAKRVKQLHDTVWLI